MGICGTNIATMGQAMVSGNVATAYNIALRQQGLTPKSPFFDLSAVFEDLLGL